MHWPLSTRDLSCPNETEMGDVGVQFENQVGQSPYEIVLEVLLQNAVGLKNYHNVFVQLERCYDSIRRYYLIAWCILGALEPS